MITLNSKDTFLDKISLKEHGRVWPLMRVKLVQSDWKTNDSNWWLNWFTFTLTVKQWKQNIKPVFQWRLRMLLKSLTSVWLEALDDLVFFIIKSFLKLLQRPEQVCSPSHQASLKGAKVDQSGRKTFCASAWNVWLRGVLGRWSWENDSHSFAAQFLVVSVTDDFIWCVV